MDSAADAVQLDCMHDMGWSSEFDIPSLQWIWTIILVPLSPATTLRSEEPGTGLSLSLDICWVADICCV